MANFLEQKERRVIPNWRSFFVTAQVGELQYPKRIKGQKKNNSLTINDYVQTWKSNKSISFASDLISAAFINDIYDEHVKEATNFILKNTSKCTRSINELAQLIQNSPQNEFEKTSFTLNFDDFLQLDNSKLKLEIKKNKEKLKNFIYNPIFYVELSRLYSIFGLKEKAVKNMKIALNLSPENRFVLRAATRLFSHFGHFGYIHGIIRKSEQVKIDPWITASEIALATILKKHSKFIKIGRGMINSDNFNWYSLTELASSIATLEFFNGNRKNTKKLLNKSLIDPNDNSLAQIEWLNKEDFILNVNPNDYNVLNNFEALALNNYFKYDYKSAYQNCIKWFLDLPFTKRPIIFGSHILISLLDDSENAIKLLKAGLYSHPYDSMILNNLAYALALDNNIDEAEKYINQLKYTSEINENTEICLQATCGLIEFRKGQILKGNDLYFKAIEAAKTTNNNYLKWLAELNYFREVLLSNSDSIFQIDNIINLIPDETKYPDVNKLKNEVIELYRIKHS